MPTAAEGIESIDADKPLTVLSGQVVRPNGIPTNCRRVRCSAYWDGGYDAATGATQRNGCTQTISTDMRREPPETKNMAAAQHLMVVVYVSSAIATLSASDLAGLVRQARVFNESHDITGVLLHHDGCFMQALEGPADVVTELFERIKRDRRHKGVIELHRELADHREFPHWSLVSAPDARALGLTLGTGPMSSGVSEQQQARDRIATEFLRTFSGPRRHVSGPRR